MKHLTKAIALCLLALLLCGCAAEQTPYERNDAEGFGVSVRYDANGGIFTTNTSVIVDSYDLKALPVSDGQAQLALIPPSHEARGNDAFTPVKNGYFLAGWYAAYEDGAYAQPWDFENDVLQLDPQGSYRAQEPVLTLYAAWAPLFQIDFVDMATGDVLESLTFDPTQEMDLRVPQWNEETGALEMHKFPTRKGYTFDSVYYDEAGLTGPANGVLDHPGTLDTATGTVQDPVLTVYTSWLQGEWYHVYTAQQFLENASVTGSYVIHNDLDFAGEIWPTSLMHGNFSGTIEGNGHTLRNISLVQTNNSKVNTGLFGVLTEEASLEKLRLENVELTIKGGTRITGASFGLLTGSASEKARLYDVTVENSRIKILENAYFGTEDYVIGLVSGMGQTGIDHSGITALVEGENPTLTAQVTDGTVTLVEAAETAATEETVNSDT